MKEEVTDQQRRFAEAKAQGKSGEEAVAFAGYKSRGKAARNQAARLMANGGVMTLIEKLRSQSTGKAVKSALDVKVSLSSLMDAAEANEDFTGFVSLAGRLAKMEGHDEPEKRKLEVEVVIGGNPEGQDQD